jgi:hypothetical protein
MEELSQPLVEDFMCEREREHDKLEVGNTVAICQLSSEESAPCCTSDILVFVVVVPAVPGCNRRLAQRNVICYDWLLPGR